MAKSILEGDSEIRLKGLLLGNPCTKSDECFPSGSERLSHYHYEFLNSKYFFSEESWKRFSEKCKAGTYDYYECYLERKRLDLEFQAANMSLLNIEKECPRYTNDYFNYPNPSCEDYSRLIDFFSDLNVQRLYHIKLGQRWHPFSKKIFEEYIGEWTSSSYWIYPSLIQNRLRIVRNA